MANVVNIDEVLGEDLELVYRGETYTVPADLDGQTVFKLLSMYGNIAKLADDPRANAAKLEKIAQEMNDTLLGLFQLRRPELKELPFGTKSLPVVLREILKQLGVGPEAGDPAGPPKRKPQTGRARASSTKQPGSRAKPKRS